MKPNNYFIQKFINNLRYLTQQDIDDIWYDPEYSPNSPCGILSPPELIDRALELVDWLDSLNLQFTSSYSGSNGEICFTILSLDKRFELEILLYPDLGDTWVSYDRINKISTGCGDYERSILENFIKDFIQ